MRWRDAVLEALHAYSDRHRTAVVERATLVSEELLNMTLRTRSKGVTPDKTLNRTLQELRNEGVVEFLSRGRYLLLDRDLDAGQEDFDDEALTVAATTGRLTFADVSTSDEAVLTRRRRGQRRLKLINRELYRGRCAACDVADVKLLIASHIARWADEPALRGKLSNVICLCRLHDSLFEAGYWGLDDHLNVIRRPSLDSVTLRVFLNEHTGFRPPEQFPPSPYSLSLHRARCGLD